MREIKFRAWHMKSNRWVEPYNLTKCFVEKIATCDFAASEDIVLMQYTGLKDKNGVEIYEGDIVKGDFPIHAVEKGYVNELAMREGVLAEVKHFLSSYALHFINLPQGEWMDMASPWNNLNRWHIGCFKYEVIGNIYENPELLEEKQCVR